MLRKVALSTIGAASLALVHTAVATPANAQEMDMEHVIDMVERQAMLAERMAKEVVLIAMGYNARENVRNLHSSHSTFDRTLNGLHYGDAELALQPASDEAVLDRLSEIEEVWPLFEASVEQAIAAGQISRSQVSAVADLAGPLEAAVEETVEAYEDMARQGNLYSMLQVAIVAASHERTATQAMAKDFFLIAYGLDVERHRRQLMEHIQEFDATLNGLMFGNSDMLLMPAPTPQLQAQLRQVERLWGELKPVLDDAARGGEIDEDGISLVSSMNLTMLTEMNTVVGMYDNL